MKFSLISLLPFAAAAAAVVSATELSPEAAQKAVEGTAKNVTSSVEKFFDDDGNDMVFTHFDEDGQEVSDSSAVRRSRKHTKHHKAYAKSNSFKAVTNSMPTNAKKLNSNTKVTWYAAHDLKNPSCGDGSWNPTNDNYIGAVGHWAGGPECGDYVNICRSKGGDKCITIRIVDSCAGCSSDHIDLTKGAFKELAGSGGLDEGVVSDLTLFKANTPNPFNTDLFGPFKLKA